MLVLVILKQYNTGIQLQYRIMYRLSNGAIISDPENSGQPDRTAISVQCQVRQIKTATKSQQLLILHNIQKTTMQQSVIHVKHQKPGICYILNTDVPHVILQYHHHTTTVLRPFFWDHPGERVPEENFWTLWCKGRLTQEDTQTIRLGATPYRLTSAHLHYPPILQLVGQLEFNVHFQQKYSCIRDNANSSVHIQVMTVTGRK